MVGADPRARVGVDAERREVDVPVPVQVADGEGLAGERVGGRPDPLEPPRAVARVDLVGLLVGGRDEVEGPVPGDVRELRLVGLRSRLAGRREALDEAEAGLVLEHRHGHVLAAREEEVGEAVAVDVAKLAGPVQRAAHEQAGGELAGAVVDVQARLLVAPGGGEEVGVAVEVEVAPRHVDGQLGLARLPQQAERARVPVPVEDLVFAVLVADRELQVSVPVGVGPGDRAGDDQARRRGEDRDRPQLQAVVPVDVRAAGGRRHGEVEVAVRVEVAERGRRGRVGVVREPDGDGEERAVPLVPVDAGRQPGAGGDGEVEVAVAVEVGEVRAADDLPRRPLVAVAEAEPRVLQQLGGGPADVRRGEVGVAVAVGVAGGQPEGQLGRVRLRPAEAERALAVAEEGDVRLDRAARRRHGQVEVAVPVDVRHRDVLPRQARLLRLPVRVGRQGAARVLPRQDLARGGRGGQVLVPVAVEVAPRGRPELQRLGRLPVPGGLEHAAAVGVDAQRRDVPPRGGRQLGEAVAVPIPEGEVGGGHGDARPVRRLGEGPRDRVVDRVGLAVRVAEGEVEEAVPGDVGDGDGVAGPGLVRLEGVDEVRPAAVAREDAAGDGGGGDDEIEVAVGVHIGPGEVEPRPQGRARPAHGEPAAAVVEEDPDSAAGDVLRDGEVEVAVPVGVPPGDVAPLVDGAGAGGGRERGGVVLEDEVEAVAGEGEVDVPVAVGVPEGGVAGPRGLVGPDLVEPAASVPVPDPVRVAVVRDDQLVVSVAVPVAPVDADAQVGRVVVPQRRRRHPGRRLLVDPHPVQRRRDREVLVPVAVEVAPGDAVVRVGAVQLRLRAEGAVARAVDQEHRLRRLPGEGEVEHAVVVAVPPAEEAGPRDLVADPVGGVLDRAGVAHPHGALAADHPDGEVGLVVPVAVAPVHAVAVAAGPLGGQRERPRGVVGEDAELLVGGDGEVGIAVVVPVAPGDVGGVVGGHGDEGGEVAGPVVEVDADARGGAHREVQVAVVVGVRPRRGDGVRDVGGRPQRRRQQDLLARGSHHRVVRGRGRAACRQEGDEDGAAAHRASRRRQVIWPGPSVRSPPAGRASARPPRDRRASAGPARRGRRRRRGSPTSGTRCPTPAT